MPKNSCIMQIWAESGKSALPICNYSQILYQFLTFTQNLKRSLTLPHIFNTDNISVLVMFIFPFLYGIFANEMFYTTKSIWMPTGFHWLWNYTITSLFLVTGTQSFIYVHIIAAMIIMIPLFYIVIGKTRLKKTSPQKL